MFIYASSPPFPPGVLKVIFPIFFNLFNFSKCKFSLKKKNDVIGTVVKPLSFNAAINLV